MSSNLTSRAIFFLMGCYDNVVGWPPKPCSSGSSPERPAIIPDLIFFYMITVYCLFLHLVADFFLQSREMGKKKSSEWRWLALHLLIQFAVMMFGLGIATFFTDISLKGFLLLPILNTVIHGVIDWNIWKLYKYSVYRRLLKKVISTGARKDQYEAGVASHAKNWQYWEDHWFYTTIGVDQFLHAATLVLLVGALL